MRIEELAFSLNPTNIAAEPPDVRLGTRDLGRMLVVDRASGRFTDCLVRDLTAYVEPGDVFVVNNSKRIPGILFARTREGAQVECRFAKVNAAGGVCRITPRLAVRLGVELLAAGGSVLRIDELGTEPWNLATVTAPSGDLIATLKSHGRPIPIFWSNGYWSTENYNNFYASAEGATESPMAGIHLTPELFESFGRQGADVAFITLHPVGGWLPFTAENVADHRMQHEQFEVGERTVEVIQRAKARGGKVIACGSTVLRALESAFQQHGRLQPASGETSLYITPGFPLRVVDRYFTNFHTYLSSLMVLDAAVAGVDLVKSVYRYAAEQGYLFHEFGDAVLYL